MMATNYFKWFGQKIRTYGNEQRGHMLVTVPSVTQHIHEGNCFDVSGTGTLNATTQASYTFVSVIGDIPMHFHSFDVTADDGPVTIELIESPTVTVQGSAVTPLNRNRASTITSDASVYANSTVTDGTVLATRQIYGGDVGAHGQGGSGAIAEEWVLSPNTTYAVRITNDDLLASVNFSASFFYYEIDL